MTAYEQAQREFRIAYFLRAAVESGGNIGRAARRLGVHRNTVWRAVKAAGYDSARLKRRARIETTVRKPPASVPAQIEARRMA